MTLWFSRLVATVLLMTLFGQTGFAQTATSALGPLVEKPGDSHAQARAANVAQVVAGILSYARWPEGGEREHGPVLCIVEPTAYADVLMAHAHQARNPGLSVIRVQAQEITGQAQPPCGTVYIGELEAAEHAALLRHLVGKPVLTISENTAQCNDGSLFCLRISDVLVAFEVNLDSVARSGIRINPQVLKLARPGGKS